MGEVCMNGEHTRVIRKGDGARVDIQTERKHSSDPDAA